jgi:anti-anti-sigma regulatory factor
MSPSPSIRTVQTPRGLVVEIGGDHDLRTVPDIQTAIEAAGPDLWLVDLTACSFIDSTVVNELANRPAEHPLTVVAPRGGFPRRMLDWSPFRASG